MFVNKDILYIINWSILVLGWILLIGQAIRLYDIKESLEKKVSSNQGCVHQFNDSHNHRPVTGLVQWESLSDNPRFTINY